MQHRSAALFLIAFISIACASGERDPEGIGGDTVGGATVGANGAGNGAADGGSTSSFDGPGGGPGTPGECQPCSADLSQVLDCNGNVVETCPEGLQCGAGVCMAPCDAAAANQFYVFSHPHALGPVQTRMEDILQVRNPSDPFAHKPELGAELRRALRAAS